MSLQVAEVHRLAAGTHETAASSGSHRQTCRAGGAACASGGKCSREDPADAAARTRSPDSLPQERPRCHCSIAARLPSAEQRASDWLPIGSTRHMPASPTTWRTSWHTARSGGGCGEAAEEHETEDVEEREDENGEEEAQ